MTKLHPATSLAVIFIITSIICFFYGYQMAAVVFSTLAFFAATVEVSKFTSYFQFITVTTASILTGVICEGGVYPIPFFILSMLCVAANGLGRIVFFRHFTYSGYLWFEPLMLVCALLLYWFGNRTYPSGWQGYVYPAPLLLFAVGFTYNILNDNYQLPTSAAYKVKIGSNASDFSLPDQNGQTTKLSDFKDNRHVLLIFVRGDWCPGCHMMLRIYERNKEKFAEKNVIVMAIGPDNVGVNREMVEKLGVDYKVLSDEGQRTAMVYGVQLKEYRNEFATTKYTEGIPLPASFLIDKQGVVRYVSRPDKVGEFLNPAMIFPVLEKFE